METPKVYIVNLNSHNNGKTRGKWYELPVDPRQVKRDLRLDSEHGEEYAIHDHEDIKGFKISEYSSLKELNAYAEDLEELEDLDNLEDFLEIYSLEEVMSYKNDLYFVEASDNEDLAAELIAQMGGVETLDKKTLERYFDFSAFGRDLALTDYAKTRNGYIRNR